MSKSYVWVYRTSKYNTHPAVVYKYTLGRSGDYAKKFLADWNGTYLHCDGYVGYKKLVGKTLCGCLVHAKRKFHEAYEINKSNEYAKQGETYLRKLFQPETKNDLIPQKYLTFVFDTIQSGREASSLVPWSDEIPESCKNKKS